MKRAITSIAALTIVVTTFALVPAPPALAASDATINGTVINGTTGKPVSGLSVSLSQANTQTNQPNENMDQTVSDDHGKFRFSVVGGNPYIYDVGAKYQDATYLSKALTPQPGEEVSVRLTVFDTTDSPENMSISSWIVYLDKDPNGIAVEQNVTYTNSGKTTYPGIAMPGSKDFLSVELPVAATGVANSEQTDGFFAQCCSGVVEGTFGFTAPFFPGPSQGTLRYISTSPASLTFPAQFPTASFTMYVAPEITATAEGLAPAGSESLPGGGPSPTPIVYTKYTAANLAAGQSVTASVTLAGNKPPTIALILLALAGLAALFLVVVKLRTAAVAPGARSSGPRRVPASAVQRKASRPKRPSHSEQHDRDEIGSDLLIAEIAALDASFDQGLIEEGDYRKLRATRKAQLLETHHREESGG